MLAYHNKQSIKNKYLARVRTHAKADEIIKGVYWKNGKGCAIGCTIEGSDHTKYETELGIPEQIAHLEDTIFEGLPNKLAMTWPLRFIEAIKPGSDLSLIWPKFAVWLLVDKKDGVIRFADTNDAKQAIRRVATLYRRIIRGDTVIDAEWQDAGDDAAGAVAEAAEAATRVSRVVAEAIAWDVRTARAAAYQKMSEKLLKLLKEA